MGLNSNTMSKQCLYFAVERKAAIHPTLLQPGECYFCPGEWHSHGGMQGRKWMVVYSGRLYPHDKNIEIPVIEQRLKRMLLGIITNI